MKAMILAAGRGERLRPLTETIPKPMIPISSEPLIAHQLRWLRRAGYRDVVINVHHLAEQVTDYVGTGRQFGVHVTFSREEELLDTGGGIARVLPFFDEQPFTVLNGDIWTNFSFEFSASEAPVHVVLTTKPAHLEAGDFAIENGVMTRPHESQRGFVFTGMSRLHPRIFNNVAPGAFSLADLLFEYVQKQQVSYQLFDGIWIDVGTYDQLKRVRRLVA